MAKKKSGPDLTNVAERAIQAALASIMLNMPEAEYVEKALTALELVTEGLKMRQQELNQGD